MSTALRSATLAAIGGALVSLACAGCTVTTFVVASTAPSTPARSVTAVATDSAGPFDAIHPSSIGATLATASGTGDGTVQLATAPGSATALLVSVACRTGDFRITTAAGALVLGGHCTSGARSEASMPAPNGLPTSLRVQASSAWTLVAAAG